MIMIRLFLTLVLVVSVCRLEAQYDVLKDPRRGGAVRYAGDFASKPAVLVPKQLLVRKHDFRGVWVATVENIDFPVTRSVEEFKRKYLQVIGNLRSIGANAILFQVRPMNDAFYRSNLNPWSRCLTGTEGTGLPGGFDPLPFMIQEARKQGLRFHAWLNPYRVVASTKLRKAAYLKTLDNRNFAKRNPHLVLEVKRPDGTWSLLLNPGEPRVVRHIIETVREIVETGVMPGLVHDAWMAVTSWARL